MRYSVIDAHCDTAYELYKLNGDLYTNSLSVSIDQIHSYASYIQMFAIWSDPACSGPDAMEHTKRVIAYFKQQLLKYHIPIIQNRSDLEQYGHSNGLKALLAVEGGEPIQESLDQLYTLYHMGVRLLTLTWNGTNAIGRGSLSDCSKGLTSFGKEVVTTMHRIGMMVDVSHLNENGFYDVMDISLKPVIASHSNAQAVHPHKRNLSDEQFKVLRKNGGVVGLNIYPIFLGKEKNLSALIDHLEHFLSLGGENHIGIGTDFDGIDCTIPEITNASQLYRLADRLIQMNYSDQLVQKILFHNMYRVIRENLND